MLHQTVLNGSLNLILFLIQCYNYLLVHLRKLNFFSVHVYVGCWLCWMRLMLLSLVTRNGFRIHITFNSVLIKSFYGGYKVELFSPKVQINILSLLMTPKVWLILYCAIVEEWSVKRAANEKRVQLITLHLMSGADVKRRVEAGVWC